MTMHYWNRVPYWKIVSNIIRHSFKVNIIINERVLLGYQIGNRTMNLVNINLNFAHFIVDRNYIRERFEEKKNRTHAKYSLEELKT